ncbi:Uncharacterised protein [Mycobacteroides abscessus subsp. abscessus]|nr:Uncharacterised protein [Mycobacteroides abscessus subsp. abscessus]
MFSNSAAAENAFQDRSLYFAARSLMSLACNTCAAAKLNR